MDATYVGELHFWKRIVLVAFGTGGEPTVWEMQIVSIELYSRVQLNKLRTFKITIVENYNWPQNETFFQIPP